MISHSIFMGCGLIFTSLDVHMQRSPKSFNKNITIAVCKTTPIPTFVFTLRRPQEHVSIKPHLLGKEIILKILRKK